MIEPCEGVFQPRLSRLYERAVPHISVERGVGCLGADQNRQSDCGLCDIGAHEWHPSITCLDKKL